MGRQEVLPEAHSFAPFVKEEFCCPQDADLPNKELWSLDRFATTLSYTDIGQPSPHGTEEVNWIVKVGTAHCFTVFLIIYLLKRTITVYQGTEYVLMVGRAICVMTLMGKLNISWHLTTELPNRALNINQLFKVPHILTFFKLQSFPEQRECEGRKNEVAAKNTPFVLGFDPFPFCFIKTSLCFTDPVTSCQFVFKTQSFLIFSQSRRLST